MEIAGIKVDKSKLMSKDALINFLKENGESDRALAHIRERYLNELGNEMIWLYPISDNLHMGTFIVTVQEGFLSIPYDSADKEDYELLELEDASMFTIEALQVFIEDFKLFADDLLAALSDMIQIVSDKK